jgi:hypothetical protein
MPRAGAKMRQAWLYIAAGLASGLWRYKGGGGDAKW